VTRRYTGYLDLLLFSLMTPYDKKTIRPLIGITCHSTLNLPKTFEFYVESLTKAGGRAVILSPERDIAHVCGDVDGVLIPGGKDLVPSFYGETLLHGIDPEDAGRIEFEFSLLHEIIRQERPVLGICYGMQVLNVFLGGTLYQDISSQVRASFDHRHGTHMIEIGGNPFLEEGSFEVNSTHHQAVKDLGKGISPFALAPDGIIEAVFLKGHIFFVGVQWHPERMDNIPSQQLFEQFVGACGATDR
jgi:putative glutamine amidotransferase